MDVNNQRDLCPTKSSFADFETSDNTKTFKAWVPNVTGRLSFSHIEPTRSASENFGFNVTHTAGVDIFCVDERNSSDTSEIFGKSAKNFIDKIKGKSGRYRFIVIGHSGEDFEALQGTVFKITEAEWQRNVARVVERLRKAFPVSGNNIAAYRARAHATIDEVSKFCGLSGNHHVKFLLKRNGELELKFCFTQYKFEASFKDAASSIFRFFREICHRHQHHTARNDVLVDAFEETEGVDWRREALYSMMRYVIMSKRAKDLDAFHRALGVTAYAEAFHKSFFEKNEEYAGYNFVELRASLSTGIDALKWRDQKIPSWIAFSGYLLACASLLLLIFRVGLSLPAALPSALRGDLAAPNSDSLEWVIVFEITQMFNKDPLAASFAIALFYNYPICLPSFYPGRAIPIHTELSQNFSFKYNTQQSFLNHNTCICVTRCSGCGDFINWVRFNFSFW
ncbi:MAG: hypothetical protein AAGF60_06750 [Pseudomonadota bacterium]